MTIGSMMTTLTGTVRCYDEMIEFNTLEERFAYLRLDGLVGSSTFGFDRYVNQNFYRSPEWQSVRSFVITRDNGCDLGVPGYDIHQGLLVHHMNPISMDDIVHQEDWILDPRYLVTTCHRTHNAIHFSDESLLPATVIERTPGDTTLW